VSGGEKRYVLCEDGKQKKKRGMATKGGAKSRMGGKREMVI